MIYQTMTTGGVYGSPVEAETHEEATAKAEASPYRYKVLDVIEWENGLALIVADD